MASTMPWITEVINKSLEQYFSLKPAKTSHIHESVRTIQFYENCTFLQFTANCDANATVTLLRWKDTRCGDPTRAYVTDGEVCIETIFSKSALIRLRSLDSKHNFRSHKQHILRFDRFRVRFSNRTSPPESLLFLEDFKILWNTRLVLSDGLKNIWDHGLTKSYLER